MNEGSSVHCVWRSLLEAEREPGAGGSWEGGLLRVMGGHRKVRVSGDPHVLGVAGCGEGGLWQVTILDDC